MALLEAPLADFGTFGDPDTEGSFRPDDLRAMKKPAWRKKVENAFAKSPYKFNIYIYNGAEGMAPVGKSDERLNVRNLENLNKYAGVTPLNVVETMIGKLPPEADSSISVILVENEGGQRMPLTPWILVHRCVHAILYAESDNDLRADNLGDALKMLARLFTSFIHTVEEHFRRTGIYKDQVLAANYNQRMPLVASIIGKMKSAKNNKLANDGEFYVETITQYIINGHVSFERPMLDDKGLAPEHPAMAVIPKEYQNAALISKNANDFLFQLGMKLPKQPYDSYTAYDQDGKPMIQGWLNPERQQQAIDRGYTVKVKKVSPRVWATYDQKMEKRQNLKNLWNQWNEAGLINWDARKHATASSDLHNQIGYYETALNKQINVVLSKCVGKALIL